MVANLLQVQLASPALETVVAEETVVKEDKSWALHNTCTILRTTNPPPDLNLPDVKRPEEVAMEEDVILALQNTCTTWTMTNRLLDLNLPKVKRLEGHAVSISAPIDVV